MHIAFQYFVIIFVTQIAYVSSENVTNTMTNSFEINSTTKNQSIYNHLWSRKNDFEVTGFKLLILGIVADVVVLSIPVFIYFCMTRYVHRDNSSRTISQASILKYPASKDNFYTRFHLKKNSTAEIPIQVKEHTSPDNLNNSKEGETSNQSSFNYPIHSSDVSLLTAVKRDCKILYTENAENENELVEKTVLKNESETEPEKAIVSEETRTKSSNSTSWGFTSSASNTVSNKMEEKTASEFSDNLKHYWPQYVTALQDPATLQQKNRKLIEYYKSKKLLNFLEEKEEYESIKKEDSEAMTTPKRKNSRARYLRIDPPVNLDDPWISDDIRKKYKIPNVSSESHKALGSKDAFVNFSPCTVGTKSQLHSMYTDIQDRKFVSPSNYGKESLLPPPVPRSLSTEERRMRLNYPQCLKQMRCFQKEDIQTAPRKLQEFGNKVHQGLRSTVNCGQYKEPPLNNSDPITLTKDRINDEHIMVKKKSDVHVDKAAKSEKKKSHQSETTKVNTTVEITVPKRLDMSRPASVPATSSDNIKSQANDISNRITSSDVPALGTTRSKKEIRGLDSPQRTDRQSPSVPKAFSEKDSKKQPKICETMKTSLLKSFEKPCCIKKGKEWSGVSSGDTIREMTFASPDLLSANEKTLMQHKPHTKIKIQQEEIRQQKHLTIKKKNELHQKKREEHRDRLRKQRETQKQKHQPEKSYDTSEMTTSKPWELKDFVEYEYQEMERRATGDGKMSDSLTSGSFVDRFSPYRMRDMDESFMESVRLGRSLYSEEGKMLGVSDSISSGVASNNSTNVLGPVFVKNEPVIKGSMPDYIFYDINEKVSPVKDKTFYTMEYKAYSSTLSPKRKKR